MEIFIDKHTSSSASNHETLSSFLGIDHRAPDAIKQAQNQIIKSSYPRLKLVSTLTEYNKSIHNDDLALKNIERLTSPEQGCIVTGQQLGMMGGPAYTILKGISCLLMARETGAVPIFWLATEDHDIAEIDHTYLLEGYGNLNYFHLSFPKDGCSVEDLTLNKHNLEEINRFLHCASIDKVFVDVNMSYSQIMAQIMVKLFEGTGMVFLEPKLLRPLAAPFFRREIDDCVNLQKILQATTSKLTSQGGKAVITFDGGTNLFLKDGEGRRNKITCDGDIFYSNKNKYTKHDLLSLAADQPWRFSTNVAARPVLQSLLIPTIAYVAGPSEMEYHRQLKDYYRAHNVAMPCIVPRISATFIPSFAADILAKCKLDLSKELPHHWSELPLFVNESLEQMGEDWRQSALKHISNEVSLKVIERVIKYSLHKLQKKMIRSRLKDLSVPSYGLHLLHNLIHPHNKPQERVLNWWSFQSYSQENLVHELLKLPTWKPQGHLYCYC